jgi:lipoprotein-anchoring transpeptidase ErfK/SrfK
VIGRYSAPELIAASPEKIGKTESHGCIRLTNWDALDLAGMARHGTIVDFAG